MFSLANQLYSYITPATKTSDSRAEEAGESAQAPSVPTAEPATQTDEQGRTLGLEDPSDPALEDNALELAATVGGLVPADGKPFVDPKIYGGSSLNRSAGLGEPLNVIVSSLSSPAVLTRKGLRNYFRSLDFDFECLGLHSGNPQQAFLDPRGWVDQAFLFREVYTPLDHVFGTCLESLAGGNHIRAWQQAGTGAWFLAVSSEMNVTKSHAIIPDGYDIGRDEMVRKSQSHKDGRTSFFGKHYRTKVEWLTGYLPEGSEGVNHGIALDGRTALLTVELIDSSGKLSTEDNHTTGAKPFEEVRHAATALLSKHRMEKLKHPVRAIKSARKAHRQSMEASTISAAH